MLNLRGKSKYVSSRGRGEHDPFAGIIQIKLWPYNFSHAPASPSVESSSEAEPRVRQDSAG